MLKSRNKTCRLVQIFDRNIMRQAYEGYVRIAKRKLDVDFPSCDPDWSDEDLSEHLELAREFATYSEAKGRVYE